MNHNKQTSFWQRFHQRPAGCRICTNVGALRLMILCCIILCPPCLPRFAAADDEPNETKLIKHQITGLFCPERERDLRDLFEQKLPQFRLKSVDYENAVATFEYDPAKHFPGAKPEQFAERFDSVLRQASRSTFGAKPLRTIARDKLTLVEIPILGLDCKACSLAAYESVYRLNGVEQATASFKEGKVTALIDVEKIDRLELETALKKRGVQIKLP